MAANKIIVKFKPDGHEDLIRAIKRLSTSQKKLNNSIKKGGEVSAKTSQKTELLGTRNQRLAETNNKLATSFATIRSKMLLFSFAMSLGIRQIGQMVREAAALEGMSLAFDRLSGGSDDATIAIDKLRAATNNTVSDFDLFQQANNAMILGVSRNSDEMAEMFDIAQRLGRALGRDTRSSVESLITGIGRQSRLMLDNIGLIVKSEEAYKTLARALNKNVSNLTDSERKQAFLNATMESARQKVSEFGTETLGAVDKFDALSASFENLGSRLGAAGEAFAPVSETLAKFLDMFTDKRIDQFIRAIGLIVSALKGLAVVLAVSLLPLIGLFLAAGGSIAAIGTAISGSYIAIGATALTASFGLIALTDAAKDYLFPAKELTEEQKRLNEEFAMGADTLADLDTGSSYEELAEELLRYGESVETVTNAQHRLAQERKIVDEMFDQTNEGRLANINSIIETINLIDAEVGISEKLAIVLDDLIAKKEKLLGIDNESTDAKEDNVKATKDQNKAIIENAVISGRANASLAASAIQAASDQIKAKLAVAIADLMADYIEKLGFFGLPLAAGAGAVVGSMFDKGVAAISGTFQDGGLVGGRLHSQGGTIIEAERGEFVMSRDAVDAIGIENLNRMNQGEGGSITVNVSGNVMTDDFVENELAEKVSTAIRRGISFGMS